MFLPTAQKRTFSGKSGSVPRRRDAPSRIVIHTTETNQLPGYNGGRSAPHFTIGVGDPGSLTREPLGAVRVWQHVSLDRTAYALKHPRGTPETNHMGAHCIQIECVTYVGDQPDHGIVGNRGNLPAALTIALAGLVREIITTVGDINTSDLPELWSATRSSGPNAKQRLTSRQWERFNGICGHQHVPNNSHWDPGAFDITGFIGLVQGASNGSGATAPTPSVSSTVDWPMLFEEGDRGPHVVTIRSVLQALGHGDFSITDLYNPKVAEAVTALQKEEKITVDGIWGPETHSHARARIAAELER